GLLGPLAAPPLPARALYARAPPLRTAAALADFVAEFGERGLRELGGRREAERWLREQPPGADVATLERALRARVA
ncbi:MAG: hypothetical protein ACR2GZ_05660, partial [Solirubrobacteraceae bacterium]